MFKITQNKFIQTYFFPIFATVSENMDAQVAELVDALVSGTSVRKDVQVRVLFWALTGYEYNNNTFIPLY